MPGIASGPQCCEKYGYANFAESRIWIWKQGIIFMVNFNIYFDQKIGVSGSIRICMPYFSQHCWPALKANHEMGLILDRPYNLGVLDLTGGAKRPAS